MLSKTLWVNFLLIVGVILAGLNAYEVWSGGKSDLSTERAIKDQDDPARPSPVEEHPKLPPASEYKIIIEKNLFSAARKPPEPEVEELPYRQPSALPSLQGVLLSGVIISGEYRAALIRNAFQGNQERWMNEGDEVRGHRISSILKDRIILSQGEERFEIFLYDSGKRRTRGKPDGGNSPTVVTLKPEEKAFTSTDSASAEEKAQQKPVSESKENLQDGKQNAGDPDRTQPSDGKTSPEPKKSAENTEYIIIKTPFGEIRREKP